MLRRSKSLEMEVQALPGTIFFVGFCFFLEAGSMNSDSSVASIPTRKFYQAQFIDEGGRLFALDSWRHSHVLTHTKVRTRRNMSRLLVHSSSVTPALLTISLQEGFTFGPCRLVVRSSRCGNTIP